ncbi:hypothetical protein [Nocardioides sp. J54]|uniref:hypothetical protein n=1 Tax=Nocardioides sp. J54 TaxID=935866 RepID=UPI000491480E|nr:hypothetical protein [Nocardioides sp. J54]
MSKHRMRAVALLAAGAVAGGATAATLTATAADDDRPATAAAGEPGSPRDDDGHGPRGWGHGGPGGAPGFGPGGDQEAFAEALGVSEDELADALAAVRDDLWSNGRARKRSGPLTEQDREERRDAFAEALADELGIGKAKVTDAIESLRSDWRAERRADLEKRLDEAVADGDLTDADKASVLKAYDAGVLGPHSP